MPANSKHSHSKQTPSHPTPKALVVRLGAMGDVLHALPAVAMLRRALPEARIGWVVERRWRELLCAPEVELAGSRGAGRPLVDEVHLVDTRAWRKRLLGPETRRDFQAAIQGMQAREYDAALDLQGAIKSAVIAKLSGARTTLGFRKPRERLARWLYDSQVDGRPAHVIEQNLELVQSLAGGDRTFARHRDAAIRVPPCCRATKPAKPAWTPFCNPWDSCGRPLRFSIRVRAGAPSSGLPRVTESWLSGSPHAVCAR